MIQMLCLYKPKSSACQPLTKKLAQSLGYTAHIAFLLSKGSYKASNQFINTLSNLCNLSYKVENTHLQLFDSIRFIRFFTEY